MAEALAVPAVTVESLFGGSELSPVENPWPAYRKLRDEAPVQRVRTPGGDSYLVTRYADVRNTLKNDRVFSNRSNRNGISLVMGRTIIEMDGAEHTRHRSIIKPSLAPRALSGDFPRMAARIAHQQIDAFAHTREAELVSQFTFTYPLAVFLQILGIPAQDTAQVHRWAIELTHVARDPARGLAGSARLAEYLQPVVEERAREPSDDLISRLVHAEVDGCRMQDEEVISFLRLLVIAGAETTYHMMGSALYALLTNREAFDEVLADRSLLPALIEETLRWESPVQMVTREALVDTEMADCAIPAGAGLVLAIGSANRDERVFEDPDRFDLHRDASEHVAFGLGRHFCAGSRLALLEARVGLEALFERLPSLRLAPDAPAAVVGLAFRGPNALPVRFG